MAFSVEEIQKLARLARLSLTHAEVQKMKEDLSNITKYIGKLQQVDVENIEPMTHAIPMDMLLRKDEEKEGIGRKGLMQSAGYEAGLVRVPKIIE